jgi:hypothetical protein
MFAEEARRLGEIEREIQREHKVYKDGHVSVHAQTISCTKALTNDVANGRML